MKNLMMIIVALFATTMFVNAQVSVVEIAYDSLNNESQKLFSQYGIANPYGKVVKTESDSIIAIFKVTNIPASRKMVKDSAGVSKPEFPTQYMVIYIKDGKKKGFVTTDNPTVNGDDAASIAALMSDTGLKQGDDDDFENSTVTNQTEYGLSEQW